jgi:chemotaxis response regulator CheB
MPADADQELYASSADLDASLKRVAEQHPDLVALGWVMGGNAGSLCVLRESDSIKVVILPSSHRSAQALAWAIHLLPAPLVEVVEQELAKIRATSPDSAS